VIAAVRFFEFSSNSMIPIDRQGRGREDY